MDEQPLDYAEAGAMLPGLVVQMLQACADRRFEFAAKKALEVSKCAEVVRLWAREKSAPLVKLGPE